MCKRAWMLLPFTRSETLGLAQAHILYKLFLQTNFIKTCERSLLDKNLNCLLSEKMNGCQIYQKILHIDPSLGFKWSGFWMGSETWNWSETSGFQMVGIVAIAIAIPQPFDNLAIWNPAFKNSGFQMFPNFRSPLYHLKSIRNVWFSNGWYCSHYHSYCPTI